MIGKGFSKCEIWNQKEYLAVHIGTKAIRQSQIATRYMDILIANGVPYAKAQQLLGMPLLTGTIDELSNHMELWDKKVTNIHIQGFLRRKIIIILEERIENNLKLKDKDIFTLN